MKNAVLAVVALGALSAVAQAQQQEYVWVTNRGSGTVAVYDVEETPAPTTPVRSFTLPGDPYGIVGIPALRRVYVSYSTTVGRLGRVAIIDTDTYQVVNDILIPGAVELRRMCASRDNTRIYIAGREQTNTTGAVWKLDLTAGIDNPGVIFIDEVPGSIGPAEDVTEIAASAVGGTGNGPGKVYYTIPQGATGAIGIFNAVTTVGTAVAIPVNTVLPWGIDRAPDDSFVVVGVAETAVGQWKVLQITSLTDATFERIVAGITFASRIWDVAFVPGAAGPDFPIFMLGQSGAAYQMFTWVINGSGFGAVASRVQSGSLEPPNFRTLALNVNAVIPETRLYMGNDAPASIAFGRSPSPPGGAGWNPAADGGATAHVDPTDFAFMPPAPGPTVFTVCPKGNQNVVGNEITVIGKDFQPGAQVLVPGGAGPVAIPTTVINPFLLRATINVPMFLAENDIIVRNPDLRTFTLQSYYAVLSPGTTAYAATVPGAGQGYRMVSFPAYYTKAMLRQALASSFGPYNRSRYRVFFWKLNRYVEIPELDEESCDLAGGAFWVISRFGGTLDLDAIDARSNHTSADVRVIPLKPGWNMISNPFVSGGLVSKVWATVNVTDDPQTWAGAAPADTSPLLSPLFEFVNRKYQLANTLVAGRGYFVKNIAPGNTVLYLLVDTNVTKPSVSAAPASTAVPAGVELPPGPPGGVDDNEDSGCGVSGLEVLLFLALARAYRRARRRRTLAA